MYLQIISDAVFVSFDLIALGLGSMMKRLRMKFFKKSLWRQLVYFLNYTLFISVELSKFVSSSLVFCWYQYGRKWNDRNSEPIALDLKSNSLQIITGWKLFKENETLFSLSSQLMNELNFHLKFYLILLSALNIHPLFALFKLLKV